MSESVANTPIFVDLDGTLIKTDSLLESALLLVKSNPFYLFILPFWLLQGRAAFKHKVASRVVLSAQRLPVNQEFFAWLENQKERDLILISASNQKTVDEIAQSFDLFSAHIGSTQTHNLKGKNKLRRIRKLCGESGFAYAGNSHADLPIWEAASQKLLVNCPASLKQKLNSQSECLQFDQPGPWLGKFWRTMRPHQWLKNGLLFVPLILAHQVQEPDLVMQALLGFLSFSLCASSVYILNDLMDLNADRAHSNKKDRPLASGELPLHRAIAALFLLLLAAFLLAVMLPVGFFAVLFGYWFLTVLYTFVLKRIFLLDLLVLAQLYTIRLVAGAAAVNVIASPWLLAFSMALFFSLAAVKRIIELINSSGQPGNSLPGRAYRDAHKFLLTGFGMLGSLLAVITIGFYINSEEAQRLYGTPGLLWPICVLLLLILWRLWRFALGGKLHDDPVLFAISDHPSQLATALMFLVLYLAI